MKLRQNGIVSFSIKLAAFQASGRAEPGIEQSLFYFRTKNLLQFNGFNHTLNLFILRVIR